MTQYLPPEDLKALSDAIMNRIGYASDVRTIFLSDMNMKFKNQLIQNNSNQQIQLDLDLIAFNRTERLIDGTIPFQGWLQHAARYMQAYPELSLVQKALAVVEDKSVKTSPAAAPLPAPTAQVLTRMELIVHQNDMVSFAFLEAGARAGLGVLLIKVPRYDNGVKKMIGVEAPMFAGTAWMLTKELIITNHHVINARSENEPNSSQADFVKQGEDAIAEFDFNIDTISGNAVRMAKLEAADEQLDYAILRLANPVTDRLPPARFPNEVSVTNTSPQSVNIIQHPFGHSKKVALRNNHVYESKMPFVRYFTDTDKGSSGSPVFNDKWQVIALHRGANLVKDIMYQGKATGWVNEGVQLKAIFDHLDANFKPLRLEILNN